GIPYLVEACKILKDQNIDFICKIIGDGDERANIEAQIVSLGLGDHIELMGWQTRPQVLELLSQADAMVLPSVITGTGKMEGVPVALMEALAMTLPVVASDISGVPELVIHEKTGMLAKERDPKGIADALIRIQQNPEWAAELGQAGREHVLANFDQKKNADALYALMTASEASSQQVAQAALAT
ncbi:MAG: glycosyltransferase, partial [Pseudomonadota bacterium]